MKFRRERVSALVHKEIISILRDGELYDDRLTHASVTVSEVNMSPDLRQATVYFTLDSGDETTKKSVRKALDHASGFMQRQIAKRLDLRFTPRLQFKYDPSMARGARIDHLLASVVHEQSS